MIAALGLLGLPFAARAVEWPDCKETPYRNLKPVQITIRDHVVFIVDPKDLHRNTNKFLNAQYILSGHLRYPVQLTDAKTSKSYTAYMMKPLGQEGMGNWGIALPEALTKQLNTEDNRRNDVIFSIQEDNGMVYESNLRGGAISMVPENVGLNKLFGCRNAQELTLTMYYRNNHAIVRQQLTGKIQTPLDAEEDQHPAHIVLGEIRDKWAAAMEKYQCDNPLYNDILSCYLTTAAVGAVGLADDCWELQTLRRFRDTVLQRTAAGRRLASRYYRFAPRLVAAISRRADARTIWLKTWAFGILPAALCARVGFNRLATCVYKRMTLTLIEIARSSPATAGAPLAKPVELAR
ncbi:MAG: hypothetical protein LBL48_12095 [Azoarcus sp.]|nr:hypothetical protein [Azoarcus sp.]